MDDKFPMRINKYMARRGFCTRKDADSLIEQGRVFINGRPAVIGEKVSAEDHVELRGHSARQYRYLAHHKPIGVVAHSPQFGERDVRRSAGHLDVFPVGRLDKRSRGLIILTNDARVTDRLLHPDYTHDKEYRVTVERSLPRDFKKRMESGVNIEGYTTKPCHVEISGDKTFTITLTEGKKHQIRRMCMALGMTVIDLQRTRVMNIRLGSLKPGETRPIEGRELHEFLAALGLPQ